jgi:arginine/lysine/ornithine decarboxylase
MDQGRAPVLKALADYHRLGRYGFTPPAHRQGRGINSRVREVMGLDPFRDDVLASAGLDDRSGEYLQQAEDLMAEGLAGMHVLEGEPKDDQGYAIPALRSGSIALVSRSGP